jgi:hypothetical protein
MLTMDIDIGGKECGKSDLFCHSERSEESLFGLNAGKERFLGAQRASVHRERSP